MSETLSAADNRLISAQDRHEETTEAVSDSCFVTFEAYKELGLFGDGSSIQKERQLLNFLSEEARKHWKCHEPLIDDTLDNAGGTSGLQSKLPTIDPSLLQSDRLTVLDHRRYRYLCGINGASLIEADAQHSCPRIQEIQQLKDRINAERFFFAEYCQKLSPAQDEDALRTQCRAIYWSTILEWIREKRRTTSQKYPRWFSIFDNLLLERRNALLDIVDPVVTRHEASAVSLPKEFVQAQQTPSDYSYSNPIARLTLPKQLDSGTVLNFKRSAGIPHIKIRDAVSESTQQNHSTQTINADINALVGLFLEFMPDCARGIRIPVTVKKMEGKAKVLLHGPIVQPQALEEWYSDFYDHVLIATLSENDTVPDNTTAHTAPAALGVWKVANEAGDAVEVCYTCDCVVNTAGRVDTIFCSKMECQSHLGVESMSRREAAKLWIRQFLNKAAVALVHIEQDTGIIPRVQIADHNFISQQHQQFDTNLALGHLSSILCSLAKIKDDGKFVLVHRAKHEGRLSLWKHISNNDLEGGLDLRAQDHIDTPLPSSRASIVSRWNADIDAIPGTLEPRKSNGSFCFKFRDHGSGSCDGSCGYFHLTQTEVAALILSTNKRTKAKGKQKQKAPRSKRRRNGSSNGHKNLLNSDGL